MKKVTSTVGRTDGSLRNATQNDVAKTPDIQPREEIRSSKTLDLFCCSHELSSVFATLRRGFPCRVNRVPALKPQTGGVTPPKGTQPSHWTGEHVYVPVVFTE